jgi:hypothetical protein
LSTKGTSKWAHDKSDGTRRPFARWTRILSSLRLFLLGCSVGMMEFMLEIYT